MTVVKVLPILRTWPCRFPQVLRGQTAVAIGSGYRASTAGGTEFHALTHSPSGELRRSAVSKSEPGSRSSPVRGRCCGRRRKLIVQIPKSTPVSPSNHLSCTLAFRSPNLARASLIARSCRHCIMSTAHLANTTCILLIPSVPGNTLCRTEIGN